MTYATCQRCFCRCSDHWNVNQAEFNIASLKHWKAQLCADCTALVEKALLTALTRDPVVLAGSEPSGAK